MKIVYDDSNILPPKLNGADERYRIPGVPDVKGVMKFGAHEFHKDLCSGHCIIGTNINAWKNRHDNIMYEVKNTTTDSCFLKALMRNKIDRNSILRQIEVLIEYGII